jgi:peptidoglycan/LPS O-acetylase OafA/YrhL
MSAPPAPRFGNQPALDGLRAVSVVAVVAYHAGFTWMTGGFYGVEVFFVVSGFLITSLLLDERERSGRIAFGRFWARRARRLLPALCTMLVAVAVWSWMLGSSEQQSQLRRDLPWGIFYVANWGQIVGKIPYYSASDPPLLRHLWSLGVEEQWYLLWPLVFAGLAALGLSLTRRAALLAGGFAAIWVGMAVVASGSLATPFHAVLLGDVDRTNLLYLSSLTRASGLLLGAAAAFVWRPWRSRRAARARQLTGLECAGAAALTVLVLAFAAAHLTEAATFRWTLPLVSIASVIVVCASVHPGAPVIRRVLGQDQLVELGKRSYGIYLWHWPIFVLCAAEGGALWRVGGALALTAVVSELCYRYVETPIRSGTWREMLTAARRRLEPSLATTTMIVALPVLLLGGLFVHYSSVQPFDRAAGGDEVDFVRAAPPTTLAAAAPAAASGPLKVTVVGDSMAHALVINRPKSLASTLAVSDGSIDGCDVFDSGSGVSATGFTLSYAQCKGWADRWAKAVTAHDADVALVVVGAWDVLDVRRPDGTTLAFGTPAFDQAYLAQLQRGIDAIAATGAKAAFLEVACMRPVSAKGAATPPLPERADDARAHHLSELFRRAVAHNPQTALFVSGPAQWCNGSAVATDLGYRWDGVHVYKPGANLIFETIAPQLQQLAG